MKGDLEAITQAHAHQHGIDFERANLPTLTSVLM